MITQNVTLSNAQERKIQKRNKILILLVGLCWNWALENTLLDPGLSLE